MPPRSGYVYSSVLAVGHRDALLISSVSVVNYELGEHPSVRKVVIQHDRVAVIVRLTGPPESIPDRITGGRPVDVGPVPLLKTSNDWLTHSTN